MKGKQTILFSSGIRLLLFSLLEQIVEVEDVWRKCQMFDDLE